MAHLKGMPKQRKECLMLWTSNPLSWNSYNLFINQLISLWIIQSIQFNSIWFQSYYNSKLFLLFEFEIFIVFVKSCRDFEFGIEW